MVRALMARALGWVEVPGWRSTSTERTPWRDRKMDALRPTGPPPTMTTAVSLISPLGGEEDCAHPSTLSPPCIVLYCGVLYCRCVAPVRGMRAPAEHRPRWRSTRGMRVDGVALELFGSGGPGSARRMRKLIGVAEGAMFPTLIPVRAPILARALFACQ